MWADCTANGAFHRIFTKSYRGFQASKASKGNTAGWNLATGAKYHEKHINLDHNHRRRMAGLNQNKPS
jgi:hypothetical protein